MISWRTAAVVLVLALMAGTTSAYAGGFDLGCEIISLDVTGTLTRVPVAFHAASDEILSALASQGMSPSDLAEVQTEFDTAIADVTSSLATFPTLVPFPLVAGGIEISLPWVVVDGLRFSGGVLTGAMVRSIAGMAGAEIPAPLVDTSFDLGGEPAHVTLDADVSAWTLSIEAVKRFDLLLAALNLSAGVDYIGGAVKLDVNHQVPAEWSGAMDAALAALHPDDVHWSALAAHVGARLELGVPFLRLYVEARLVQPVFEGVGWWDLHVGGFAGSLGVVIRF